MKKVLIITYYWPPSGGGGVQRWLKFSKYLPDFGWQPIIFTPENPDFQIKDQSLAADIPEEVEVLKLPIWEPYFLFDKFSGNLKRGNRPQGIVSANVKNNIFSRLSKWIRGNIFIPDPKVFWVGSSVDFLVDFIRDNSIKHLVTTGPPHSMHLIGLKLKKKTDVAWIADFRDPWVRWDMLKKFHLSWPAKKIHKKLESAVVRKCDIVLTVSDTWAKIVKEDYGKNALVITNGYDPQDFTSTSKDPKIKFTISHSGLINEFRNPEGLWQALRELCAEDKEFTDSLQIEFCGIVDKSVINKINSDPVLGPKFKFQNYVPHDEAIRLGQSSSVLLLLLNKSENAKGHLPGKLFEYLASNRFILALGPAGGDAASIITNTGSGETCNTDDISGIKNVVSTFFTYFKNANFPDSKNIDEYSRKALTKRLSELLEQL